MEEDKKIEEPTEQKENQQKDVDTKTAFDTIKFKVVTFIDQHQYTSIAIGGGLLVGTFLLAKHFLKRK